MTRIEIKDNAKKIVCKNNKIFSEILLLYFCIELLILLITYIVDCNRLIFDFEPLMFLYYRSTPLSASIDEALAAFLCAPIFLSLNKVIYCVYNNKKSNVNFHGILQWIKRKDFLVKSLVIGAIWGLLSALVKLVINEVNQYIKVLRLTENQFTLIPALMFILFVIFILGTAMISALLDFSYCIAALYPEKSVIWVIAKSIKTVGINIFNYIIFNLSFILWDLLQLALFALMYIIAKDLRNTYTFSALILVLINPIMLGIGFYYWPYYNTAKAIFCKDLISR